ncbi:unnamed protein product [Gongylonema pulchrum]|uniref:ShKT domain-containing protein n=1 Tax=Gongylonema pulchrum TaxID=637853 RepID=A0A183DYM2_9BILA|nr:unnamed protein product [Gongylonema pulchrum]
MIFCRYLRNSNEAALSRRKLLDGQKRFRDDSSNIAELHMGEYHSYDDIVRWLKSLERRYSDIVKVTSIGVTPEKRTIYGVRLGRQHANSTRVVWIDAGIHAREWASVHTALYFIREVFPQFSIAFKSAIVAQEQRLYGTLLLERWQKTLLQRSRPQSKFRFSFRWAVRDAVLSLSNRMEAFITLHTYSQIWVYPYSNKKFAYSPDKEVAKKAVESLGKLYGTQYRYGTGPETICIANCEDRARFCAIWKQQNPTICVDTRPSMQQLCKKTCGFC